MSQIYFCIKIFRHGLGDSYQKLFCDPKLPYIDAANKWLESKNKTTKPKETEKVQEVIEAETKPEVKDDESKPETKDDETKSDEPEQKVEETENKETENAETKSEPEVVLEPSKIEVVDKNDEPPAAIHWFTNTNLETRLHHIIHTVQNNEWSHLSKSTSDAISHSMSAPSPRNSSPLHAISPGPSASPLPRGSQSLSFQSQSHLSKHRKHIAIDVETERAKLHALLNTPPLGSQSKYISIFYLSLFFSFDKLVYWGFFVFSLLL